jgi:hypothetical protein
MDYNTIGVKLVIVVVIILDVHDSFTGSLERSATPDADPFVHCLFTISKNLQIKVRW